MKATVEISMYPFNQDFIPPIKSVIAGFNQYPNIDVVTTSTSTQLYGDYDEVMACVTAELKKSFEEFGFAVFVAKILGRDVRKPFTEDNQA
ncbi:YkoF family thiamine/hydroxymethylpyrimidine-binding protein [Motilimonas sp. KMU-193]|uniref:YkoF family thiamine/hydroxymethylpyrimidine-binding protein n=1 Tax=Motilimonas sp. KMU-193 TaxID=3388668 RepID=UPI00396B1CEF